eukprot:286674-Chlamydomonas_euryale.AAC.4
MGVTALHVAAAGGHHACASLLLRCGAPPDDEDALGRTPLLLAAGVGSGVTVAMLLKHGVRAGGGGKKKRAKMGICVANWRKGNESVRVMGAKAGEEGTEAGWERVGTGEG